MKKVLLIALVLVVLFAVVATVVNSSMRSYRCDVIERYIQAAVEHQLTPELQDEYASVVLSLDLSHKDVRQECPESFGS